jgi:RNA polymerase sigma factor (sigma-70 family)
MSTATLTTADSTPGSDQRQAFQETFARYYPQIRSALTARLGDWHIADELAQATFTRMWDKVAAGDVDLAERRPGFSWLWAWARRTTLNHNATTHTRIERPFNPVALTDAPSLDGDPGDVVADRDRVAGLLTGVPHHARTALVLHVLDNLPIEQVADLTGTTPAEATALVEQGIGRVREALGVTPDQIRARAEIAAWQASRRELTAAAQAPTDRPTVLRTSLAAAVADGTYPPGTVLPAARDLAAAHAPAGATPTDREHRIAARVLAGLHRKGILSGTPTSGYTVTDDGPRLAADYQPPLPARALFARDLLAGIWAPGTQLPSRRELARRWGCNHRTLNALLDGFVDAGAVIDGGDGSYYTAPEPGTQFAPTARPHTLPPGHHADVLAAVIDQARATGRIPTHEQIKTTHHVGADTAARIRAAAAQATGLTARTTVAALDHDQIVAAVVDQARATGRLPSLQHIVATHHVATAPAQRIRDEAAHATGLFARTTAASRNHDQLVAAVIDHAQANGRLPSLQRIQDTYRVGRATAIRIRDDAAHHTPPPPDQAATAPAAADQPAGQVVVDTGLGHDLTDLDLGLDFDLDELALDDALSL